MSKYMFRLSFITLVLASMPFEAWSQSSQKEEHVLVSLRMIGHELLRASGDSTSRILPISKVDDRYKIEFASNFSFLPEVLRYVADSIMSKSQLASAYIIEVDSCSSGNVVYSYEVNNLEENEFITCSGRIQPYGCYSILVRFISPFVQNKDLNSLKGKEKEALISENKSSLSRYEMAFFILIGFISCLLIFLRIRRKSSGQSPHLISIGSFQFDQKNMSLLKGSEKQELTGKESDLLQLLHHHLNSTVNRNIILKEVWKDEGVYIGRTLDVYISKLRKKFESDPSISIINVRGVGYKMTLN